MEESSFEKIEKHENSVEESKYSLKAKLKLNTDESSKAHNVFSRTHKRHSVRRCLSPINYNKNN